MKHSIIALVTAGLGFGLALQQAQAQSNPTAPRGQWLPATLDTGVRGNPADERRIVFSQEVNTPGAAWTRLYFSTIDLDEGSTVRFVSLLDDEVQELDKRGVAMWGMTSAYFNGERVRIDLLAAPKSSHNRLVLDQVAVEFPGIEPIGAPGQCGICGSDDRVPSGQDFYGRLMPPGCTASVYNTASCVVTAGHCSGSNQVLQFRVPNSLASCAIVNPPVNDQFPITAQSFINGGVGNDWAVMKTGSNGLSQKPFQRYGLYRPIATSVPVVGNALAYWGYGLDLTCTLSQTQQLASGSITAVSATSIQMNADVRGGDSGSAMIRSGQILGIVTHCEVGCPNHGTRVDLPAFVAARQMLCPACAGDINGNGTVNIDDLVAVITAWGVCFNPDICNADIAPDGGNNTVNIDDLVRVITTWGACP